MVISIGPKTPKIGCEQGRLPIILQKTGFWPLASKKVPRFWQQVCPKRCVRLSSRPRPFRMSAASDRDLVERARSGDSDAFGSLVRRHQRRIYRLAVHLTRSATEAEDITQDTFVRAYQALGRFDGRSEPFTWLYRITVNLSLNAIRSRKIRRIASSPDDLLIDNWLGDSQPDADPLSRSHQKRLAEALLLGVDQLSETLRTTLILVCVEGVTHEDASAVLGCPEGTIAWRVHEARRKLKAFLESRGFADEIDS